jgi:hypothetical protein
MKKKYANLPGLSNFLESPLPNQLCLPSWVKVLYMTQRKKCRPEKAKQIIIKTEEKANPRANLPIIETPINKLDQK